MPRIATTAGKAREKQTGTWPGNGEKAVAVAIKTATGTENPFRKTWQASTSISLFAKVAAITATFSPAHRSSAAGNFSRRCTPNWN